MNLRIGRAAGLAWVWCAGTALGAPAAERLANAQRQYPGLRAAVDGERVLAVYGKTMTAAATPALAAQGWLATHSSVLLDGPLDVRLARQNAVGQADKSSVFVYDQFLDGLPVEFGVVKLLVLHGQPNHVFYVGARLASVPAAGFRADRLEAAAAVAVVKADPRYASLAVWSPPRLVIYYSPDGAMVEESVRAWKFTGHTPSDGEIEGYTFFVDASNAKLVHVRHEWYDVDIAGQVNGLGSPGVHPDTATNPPVALAMPEMRVRIPGGASTFTDREGHFVLSNSGSAPVTVEANMVGRWATISNSGGAVLNLTQMLSPPGPAEFLFNNVPAAFSTAQINAAVHMTHTHNFYKDRQPGFNGLDTALPAAVNVNDSCNAGFSPITISLSFFRAAGGCANTAFSAVVAHEYGHFITHAHGLSQGAYGEGYSDVVSALMFDDPVMGRDFYGPGTFVRDIDTANLQYPCSGQSHFCGQLLGGSWWDTKLALQDGLGMDAGLEYAQQLFTDWTEVTNGGMGSNSAHPLTVIEILSVDDNDGDLDNGTPNYAAICEGFAQHSIACPPLALLNYIYPQGQPEFIDPAAGAPIVVNIESVAGQIDLKPLPMLQVSVDGAPFTPIPMTPLDMGTLFTATIPGGDCLADVRWYVSAGTTGGMTVFDPGGAPATSYEAVIATGAKTVHEEDFETPVGYSVAGNATDGQWQVGIPAGNGLRGDPTVDFDGSGRCYLTDNAPGNSDVDGGQTTLTSPVFDMTHSSLLRYARWYSNDAGDTPNQDVFTVEISNNGGTSWVPLETVGPAGPDAGGGWRYVSFRVSEYVEPTDQMRVRFIASDLGSGSVVEAAIDALSLDELLCEPVDITAPALVHDGGVGTDPFSGYVDPRAESSDGSTLDLGITTVTIKFSEPVKNQESFTGGGLTGDAFMVTGPGSNYPTVVAVDDTLNPLVTLTLSGPLPVGTWTTIIAWVEDLAGNNIVNLGNLGPGVNEPDRVDIGFLPGDIDQTGVVQPIDLLRFRGILAGTFHNPLGQDVDYADIDRNGAIQPVDYVRFRQLLDGVGNATQVWAGVSIGRRP